MYQTEITELKNTIIELNNSIEGFNSRLDHIEERISELKDKQWNSYRGAKRIENERE